MQRGPKNDYSNKMLVRKKVCEKQVEADCLSLCVEIIIGKKWKDRECDKVLAVGVGLTSGEGFMRRESSASGKKLKLS